MPALRIDLYLSLCITSTLIADVKVKVTVLVVAAESVVLALLLLLLLRRRRV